MKGLIASGIVLAAAAAAAAAAGETGVPPAAFADVIAVTAIDTVAEVIEEDAARRTLTIKDPAGRNVTIIVPPEIPLEQIARGALLDLRYVEAEALKIRKPGVSSGENVLTVAFAPLAGVHGALTAKPKHVKGRIRGIDRRKRELTVAAPDNRLIALKVSGGVAGFAELKVGDTTVIDYTEAVVLSAVKHAAGVSPLLRF